ncbi:hypothetical protein Hypma_016611 [Hypsizygus marmoreus]|uniref:Uncharacterized protein n=1 Tax=Hypsizygus marmoreus TaxID=39966 RepID=A0A369J1I2_HYPMA|nr:hypothetical protein Hypma_016611 [Hypsizygus marmoreus]
MDVDGYQDPDISPQHSHRQYVRDPGTHTVHFSTPGTDVPGHDAFSDLHRHLNEQKASLLRLQSSIDQRLSELMERIERLAEDHTRHPARRTTSDRKRQEKDSSANYFRLWRPYPKMLQLTSPYEACIRAHVKLRLGMCATQQLPDRPPQNVIARELSRINNGEDPQFPFLADLGDSLSCDWNLCVQKYFYLDFWASVRAHIYQESLIPARCKDREIFAMAYTTHMQHLKKTWQDQQQPPDRAKAESKRMHSTRNSRIGTTLKQSSQTYRNRRDAAALLPPVIARPLVDLVQRIGTAGISSDEEIPGARPRQYTIFEKPWRADALCHLYRHLDLIHAANRNPNGNPIRTRHRSLRTRGSQKPPKGLPADCFNSRYLGQITRLDKEFLCMTGTFGVERLLTEVQRLAN